MASGGFHGGGTHMGGFHSSGGFSGGGSFGGGGGGLFGSPGSFINMNQGYDSEDLAESSQEEQGINFAYYLIILAIGVAYAITSCFTGFTIFKIIIAVLLLVCCIWQCVLANRYMRTDVVKYIKRKSYDPWVFGCVWNRDHGAKPFGAVDDINSWYSGEGNFYYISFSDGFREDNILKVQETKKNTPVIYWISPFVWLILSIVWFVVSFFFYELVIPLFENRIMTDIAFKFIDILVFFFPVLMSALTIVISILIARFRDAALHECAKKIVEDNIAKLERMKTEDFIKGRLSMKWFFDNCPNCGWKPDDKETSCSRCGTPLEAVFADGIKSPVHRVFVFKKSDCILDDGIMKEIKENN